MSFVTNWCLLHHWDLGSRWPLNWFIVWNVFVINCLHEYVFERNFLQILELILLDFFINWIHEWVWSFRLFIVLIIVNLTRDYFLWEKYHQCNSKKRTWRKVSRFLTNFAKWKDFFGSPLCLCSKIKLDTSKKTVTITSIYHRNNWYIDVR